MKNMRGAWGLAASAALITTACQPSPQSETQRSDPVTTEDRFAILALDCVHREYPNRVIVTSFELKKVVRSPSHSSTSRIAREMSKYGSGASDSSSKNPGNLRQYHSSPLSLNVAMTLSSHFVLCQNPDKIRCT